MKKTLIALLALGGIAMANTYTGITFSNDNTGTGLTSLFGLTFNLKAASSDYTVTNTMSDTFPQTLTVTEISFDKAFVFNKNSRYGSGISSKDVYLYITDESGTILDISSATAVSASTNSSYAGDAVTFTLDCDNIQANTNYRAWFMGTDSGYTVESTGVKTIITTDNLVELRTTKALGTTGDLKLLTTAVGGSANSTLSNISIKSIPEPATATLSLLALAGLAARRRRH